MNLKTWFQSRKPWLRGGIIGVMICIVLYLFYVLVYFPVIHHIYAEDIQRYGGTPAWTTNIPLLTGHAFPMFSTFIVPYGFLCEFTEPTCGGWVAKELAGPLCVPWTFEGEEVCCIEQQMAPTSACATLSDYVGFFGLSFLLLAVYFGIGAIIGSIVQRRKTR